MSHGRGVSWEVRSMEHVGGTELPEHTSDHPNRIALSEAFIPRTSIGPSCKTSYTVCSVAQAYMHMEPMAHKYTDV